MRIFVTGASGWIGSAVTAELLAAGHQVTGLARSEQSAAAIESAGATALPGTLADLDTLRTAARDSEGVVHLGYSHDFSDMAGAGRTERAVLEAFGDALEGSGKPLVIASGMAGSQPGLVLTEDVASPFVGPDSMRGGSENLALSFVDRGVRAVSSRFTPTVHGEGDHGFIAHLVGIAREKGAAGYVGDGSGHWPAVHRSDAARLVRRGLESAPAGTILHAVGERGIPTREIAEAIGRGLGVPAVSIDPADAEAHFGWIGLFFGMDIQASSAATQRLMNWTPTGPTLIEDLDAGYYTR